MVNKEQGGRAGQKSRGWRVAQSEAADGRCSVHFFSNAVLLCNLRLVVSSSAVRFGLSSHCFVSVLQALEIGQEVKMMCERAVDKAYKRARDGQRRWRNCARRRWR